MIAHGLFYLHDVRPLVAREAAHLECGCRVYVGVVVDTDPPEAATGAMSCSPEHRPLIERFNLVLTDSLVNPSDRPLIDVVDELLTQTADADG